MLILHKKTVIVILSVLALAVVIAVACALPSCGNRLGFKADFYYVCYVTPTNSHSASSMSSVVHSYGGAGYIVESRGSYYVTVSCYYDEMDATSVARALGAKGLDCKVVKITAGDYRLSPINVNEREKYLGNLNTMLSLSKMCYNLANSLDDGSCNQASAKTVLDDVGTALQSLMRQNISNCFTKPLSNLVGECKDVSYGLVLSRDVRRLQIAITDEIVNINFS